ncbi:hypothetical protein CW749_27885 [Vibrio sp. vnigr-6D03]|nr:hypothetical protein CW749_27885 [Vibrio sp. vnigr-6D03]
MLEKENKCMHLALSKGQIEKTHVFKYDINNQFDSMYREVSETVDITNEVDLVIISTKNSTYYAMYSDANALLTKQVFGIRNCTGDRPGSHCFDPTGRHYVENTFSNLTASYNAWSAGGLNNVFNDVETELSVRNVPGISALWRKIDANPKSSRRDGDLNLSRSLSVGFELSGSKADGATISASVSHESGTSYDAKIMNVHQFELSSDLGSRSTFKINPAAVGALWAFNSNVESGPNGKNGVQAADEHLGESSWRNLDFSSNVVWEETNNKANCAAQNRSDTFEHKFKLFRGQYDIDGTGSYTIMPSNVRKYPIGTGYETLSVTVNTQCVYSEATDSYYRNVVPGMLNG